MVQVILVDIQKLEVFFLITRLTSFCHLFKLLHWIFSYQICEKERSKNWQKVWLDAEKAWYMTSGDQWITYEDIDSATLKVMI